MRLKRVGVKSKNEFSSMNIRPVISALEDSAGGRSVNKTKFMVTVSERLRKGTRVLLWLVHRIGDSHPDVVTGCASVAVFHLCVNPLTATAKHDDHSARQLTLRDESGPFRGRIAEFSFQCPFGWRRV